MNEIKENLMHYIFEEYLEINKMAGLMHVLTVLDNLKIVSNYYKNPVYDLILKSFRVNYSLFSPSIYQKGQKENIIS